MEKYCYDAARFCSIADKNELMTLTNKQIFRELFHGKITSKDTSPSDVARFSGYQSFLQGRPKSEIFFPKVCELLGELGGTLTYLEVTHDTIFDTAQEAIDAYFSLEKTIYLARNNVTCKNFENKAFSPSFLCGKSLYLGKRGEFQLVIYARRDKDTNEPMLRREFKITENRNILKKLCVSHEREIQNPAESYKLLANKYFGSARLNQPRIDSLMGLRNITKKFSRTCDFRSFLKSEKENAINECLRYRKRVENPFSYFLMPKDI